MEWIAKCPHCNVQLEEDDCFDTADCGDTYAKYMVGHCPQCDKEFQWQEIYNYEGIDDLREC